MLAAERSLLNMCRIGFELHAGNTTPFSLRIFVADGDPIRPRLESHYAQKDFWTRAIGFTTTTAGQPVGRVLAA